MFLFGIILSILSGRSLLTLTENPEIFFLHAAVPEELFSPKIFFAYKMLLRFTRPFNSMIFLRPYIYIYV